MWQLALLPSLDICNFFVVAMPGMNFRFLFYEDNAQAYVPPLLVLECYAEMERKCALLGVYAFIYKALPPLLLSEFTVLCLLYLFLYICHEVLAFYLVYLNK